MTLVFIMVQYSALFIRPGHGVAAPLASAAALYAIAASGKLSGSASVVKRAVLSPVGGRPRCITLLWIRLDPSPSAWS